jgi:hypothetical protein
MSYDVFLSYAVEDKASVARPLATELSRRGWGVWFDEFELKVGDNIGAALSRGWTESRVGVVVLSSAFFGKYWPRREFDALMAREFSESSKLILPVWHNVTAAEVARFSLALSDRVAIDTSVGVPQVADAIEEVLRHSLDLLEPGRLPTATGPDGRPLAEHHPARRAFDLSVAEFNDRLISHLADHPERLYELSPRRFEELVAELYSRAGFEVELTPASGDGGVDVYAVQRSDLGPRSSSCRRSATSRTSRLKLMLSANCSEPSTSRKRVRAYSSPPPRSNLAQRHLRRDTSGDCRYAITPGFNRCSGLAHREPDNTVSNYCPEEMGPETALGVRLLLSL